MSNFYYRLNWTDSSSSSVSTAARVPSVASTASSSSSSTCRSGAAAAEMRCRTIFWVGCCGDRLANRIVVERAPCSSLAAKMVLAIFNFQSMLLVCLLLIVTCTLLKSSSVPILPGLINANKTGFASIFYKFTVIGERLSPYVAVACIVMAIQTVFLD